MENMKKNCGWGTKSEKISKNKFKKKSKMVKIYNFNE